MLSGTTQLAARDLWVLVLDSPQIDPAQLAAAIERQMAGELDFRTRLLIRDAIQALTAVWGQGQLRQWIQNSPGRGKIEAIVREDLGPPGFPSLAARLMESTKAETVRQYLREMGAKLPRPASIAIGGSISLILSAHLSRHTEDIDVVDEVPAELRGQHELLENLARRYGLRLTHFQSHYLPAGWESRLTSLGRFGKLDVHVVDAHDVCLSKMFSVREKDRDDLRVLAPQLGKGPLADRLLATCASLVAEPGLRRHATENWYILFGDILPA